LFDRSCLSPLAIYSSSGPITVERVRRIEQTAAAA
jgi:hypothetical protein